MVTKCMFIEDDRFFVNSSDVDRIFNRNVKKYEICNIKLKDIRKKIDNKIIDLEDTKSYKYLIKKIDSAEYNKYCERDTFEYENHSLDSFNKLIKDFKKYSLYDGAIVIDQFGLIRDGQHRASILLNKYGPDFSLDVVKVYYSGLRIKTYIQLIRYMVNKKGKKCKNY